MAEKAFPGSMMLLYGVAVGNALTRGKATTPDLIALRDQVRAVVEAQGDLVAALKDLDAEIAQREAAAAKGAAPAAQERFVIDLGEIALGAEARARIEQKLGEAVMAELASVDTKGDLVATPLSTIKSYGGGFGGATAGMIVTRKTL